MVDVTKAFSGFAVPDLQVAKRFYGDTLGLEVRDEADGSLLDLKLGSGAHVMVYPKPDFVPATYTILNFPVTDLDATVDELTSKGVKMQRYDGVEGLGTPDAKGIYRGNDGPPIAWFTDPAGNILSVMADQPM